MELLRQITSVATADGHRLRVSFDTGESGTFDVSPLLGYACYRRLNNPDYFSRARVERGTVVWPNDEDLAPELVWEKREPIVRARA